MERDTIGVTDLPVSREGDDLLNLAADIKGLCTFITKCITPMSIALQGSWGTGKSSLIELMQLSLKDSGNKIVPINAWQFSHMAEPNALPQVFIASLLNAMDHAKRLKAREVIIKGAALLTKIGGLVINRDIDLDKLFNDLEDHIHTIDGLHEQFQQAVTEAIAINRESGHIGDRLIILVDDLDRLSPDAAVDLLETIKLFMDVKGCVFLLAIDYDVVVKGVRMKYGDDMSLSQCRSFFDKIIQLPFRMPTERYDLTPFVETYLGELSAYSDSLGDFAKRALGANPRALKRLANSYKLLRMIQDERKKASSGGNQEDVGDYAESDFAVLFCVLCIQVRQPALYDYLCDQDWLSISDPESKFSPESDEVAKIVRKFTQGDDASAIEAETEYVQEILDRLFNQIQQIYTDPATRFEKLNAVLHLAAITGQGGESNRPSTSSRNTPVSVRLNGRLSQYDSAKDAIVGTVTKLLSEASQDQVDQAARKFAWLTTDSSPASSTFSVKEILDGFESVEAGHPEQVIIGLNTSTLSKRAEIRQLAKLLNLKPGQLIWKDETFGEMDASDSKAAAAAEKKLKADKKATNQPSTT